jgi:aminoglycoside phosphotransferase family enzyme/predicted kinase
VPDGQSEIIEAMGSPGFYPHAPAGVEHLQTHISHIFLTGTRAYKVKKAVDMGFLDFGSLERRIHFCQEELRLNRRLAPHIYLAVLAIVRTPMGLALAPLETPGAPVLEVCLEMAQMEPGRQMDELLDQGLVRPEQVAQLGRLLAGFHAQAAGGPAVEFHGRPEQIRLNVEENFRQTENYQEVSVAPGRWLAIRDYSLGFLEQRRELLESRVRQGRIRDGHGDLHSGNINLPSHGPPIIFDCIEFNERFRFQDAACDLAFLAMDLDFHGRRDLAGLLVDSYVEASGDQGLGQVLDFYKCYRAVVRAKIHGFMFDGPGGDAAHKFHDIQKARAYFRLAARYAGGEPPYFLVCFMGLMGTGKTYLAKELSRAQGWLHFASDALRKQLAGLAPEQRAYDAWGSGLYGVRASEETYQALDEGAEARLALGDSVVVDASFREERWRRRFLELAEAQGARVLFVEVRASRAVVLERLARRQAQGKSISDGRPELLDRQAASWEDSEPLLARHGLVVDGGAELDVKLGQVMARLEELGHGG